MIIEAATETIDSVIILLLQTVRELFNFLNCGLIYIIIHLEAYQNIKRCTLYLTDQCSQNHPPIFSMHASFLLENLRFRITGFLDSVHRPKF
jgi:hypothetical protein